jgi:hypothetical protein
MNKPSSLSSVAIVLAFSVQPTAAQWTQENQKNWDAHMYSLEKFHERERNSSQNQGSGEGSGLAPALVLAIIGGALLEWSRQPQAQRPQVDYVAETKRQRQGLMYRQCKSTHQASLTPPKFEKPNSWGVVRLFQSDRAEEFKVAMAKYQTAITEGEPTCRCVSERSIEAGGFSEPEWIKMASSSRTERPWAALDSTRTREVFDACATHSPSNTNLSWLYAAAGR